MVSSAFAGFAEGFSNVLAADLVERGEERDEQTKYSDLILGVSSLPEGTTPEQLKMYQQDLMTLPSTVLSNMYGQFLQYGRPISIEDGYTQGSGFKIGPNTLRIKPAPKPLTEDQQRQQNVQLFSIQSNAEMVALHEAYAKANNIEVEDIDAETKLKFNIRGMKRTFNNLNAIERAQIVKFGWGNLETEVRLKLASDNLNYFTESVRRNAFDKVHYSVSQAGKNHLKRLHDTKQLPIDFDINVDTVPPRLIQYLLWEDTSADSVNTLLLTTLQKVTSDTAMSPSLASHYDNIDKEARTNVDAMGMIGDGMLASGDAPEIPASVENGKLPESILDILSKYGSIMRDDEYNDERVSRLTYNMRRAPTEYTSSQYIKLVAKYILGEAGIKDTHSNYPEYYNVIIAQLQGMT